MYCPICKSSSSSFEDTALLKTFFHCPKCEAIFLDPNFYLDQDTEKSKYENHNNTIDNRGYVDMFENFMDFFWDDIPKRKEFKALEFGCGPGPVLATLLERRGLHVEKYDPFFYPKKINEKNDFSLITSTEVFEHLQNPMDTLLTLKRYLKQEGIIALMTLFHNNNKEDFLQWWYRRDPTHIIFYTPKTFQYMAKKCGLSIKSHDNKRIITLKKK